MTTPDTTAQLLQQLLLYGLVPLWLVVGVADWLSHRVQHIEHSSGLKESLLHLLMVAELGTGVLAALLLQVNGSVILLVLACCVVHELTMWVDLRYAASMRPIPVYEQWVHGLQQALPWIGFGMLAVMHHDALGNFAWQPKEPPLPLPAIAAVVSGGLLMAVLPFAQEAWRCWKARR